MISREAKSIKGFMNTLLLSDIFDVFLVSDAVIKKDYQMTLDGNSVPYGKIRPLLFAHIKGEQVPKLFRLTLYKPAETDLLNKLGFDQNMTRISAFVLRLDYDGERARVVTGVSYSAFSMEKDLEKAWDKQALNFMEENGIELKD